MKLSDLKKGECIPGDCGNPVDQWPPWMDHNQFRRGQEFYLRHMAAILLTLHCSLAVGLSIINLLDPLVFTEKSSSPRKSFFRYFHTFLHLTLWHMEEMWEFPNGKANKSIKLVKKMHTTVAESMNKARSDENKRTKLFLSQYDMGLVQSGFFAILIMYPEKSGIKASRQDLKDYVFFWRVIGYLLGVDDKYNICSGNLEDTLSICKEIEETLLLPALNDPPKDFDKMLEAYVQGFNIPAAGFKVFTKESLFKFIADFWKKSHIYRPPSLGLMDLMRYYCMKLYVLLIWWCPWFERWCNKHVLNIFHRELRLLKR